MFKWSPEDFNASHHTRKALTYSSWSERLSSMHKKVPKKLKVRGQTELYTSQVWKDLESRSLPQLVRASPSNSLDLDVHVEPALSACSLAAVVELEAQLTRPVVGATQKYNDRISECKQELRNHVVYWIHVAIHNKWRVTSNILQPKFCVGLNVWNQGANYFHTLLLKKHGDIQWTSIYTTWVHLLVMTKLNTPTGRFSNLLHFPIAQLKAQHDLIIIERFPTWSLEVLLNVWVRLPATNQPVGTSMRQKPLSR